MTDHDELGDESSHNDGDELPAYEQALWELAEHEALVLRAMGTGRVVGTSDAIAEIEQLAVNEHKTMIKQTMTQLPEEEFLDWLGRYLDDHD